MTQRDLDLSVAFFKEIVLDGREGIVHRPVTGAHADGLAAVPAVQFGT